MLTIYEDIQTQINYVRKKKPKVVTYWLARLENPDQIVTISDEHQSFTWLGLTEAKDLAPRHAPVFDKFNEALKNDLYRKSRSSPSKKRRSRARAEAYQLKKSLFQTKNENCGIDTRSTEEVFVSAAVPVADLNKVETDEDIKDDDNTDDDASNDDDSSNDVDSSADEDSSDDDDSSADDDDASNDDEGSDLAFIVMCENYVTELARGRIYLPPQGYFKEDYETIEAWRREVTPWRGKDQQLTDIQNKLYVFKVKFGFEEGGGYNGDLSWIDFYDLHLYSRKCRTLKCEELMVIIEI